MPKTIFGTTEKSNFILNMKKDTVQKWIAFFLFVAVILPQIGNFFIASFNTSNSFLAAFLYFAGFSSFLFFMVNILRKDITFRDNKIIFAVAFIALWTIVSYYGVVIKQSNGTYLSSAEDNFISTALVGELGRYEGILAIFAYLGIFLLALCITKEKIVTGILDTIVALGAAQAIVAVFQHIPELDFMTSYADLPTMALKNVMLSSGFADSPIFYCSFVTIVLAISLSGAIFDGNKTRRLLYFVTGLLLFLTSLFTSSIVALIGGGAVVIVLGIVTLTNKKSSKAALNRFLITLGALTAIFLIVNFTQGLYFRDRQIAYYDSYYRLFITRSYSPVSKESLYETGFERSIAAIKSFPITGTGPDCFAKWQMSDKTMVLDSLDKSYNEFLYVAATRGIPSLVGYLVFLVVVVISAVKSLKGFFSDENKWFTAAIFIAIIAYLVQSFFSASTVTVAPLFWLLCGIACAKNVKAK